MKINDLIESEANYNKNRSFLKKLIDFVIPDESDDENEDIMLHEESIENMKSTEFLKFSKTEMGQKILKEEIEEIKEKINRHKQDIIDLEDEIKTIEKLIDKS